MREGAEAWLTSQNMALSMTVTDQPPQTRRGAQAGLLPQEQLWGLAGEVPGEHPPAPQPCSGQTKGESNLQGQVVDALEMLLLPPSSVGLVGLTPPCATKTCIRQSWWGCTHIHRASLLHHSWVLGCCTSTLHPDIKTAPGGGIAKGNFPPSLGCPGMLVPWWARCRNQKVWENTHKTGKILKKKNLENSLEHWRCSRSAGENTLERAKKIIRNHQENCWKSPFLKNF